LVDLSKKPIELGGKICKYILSVMDVFSPFLWLIPAHKVKWRYSKGMKNDMKGIDHRIVFKVTQGLEFMGV